MNRLRIVRKRFAAAKYCKEPPEHMFFESGQRIVFWRFTDDENNVVFGYETDISHSDPYTLDRGAFEANTEVVASPTS